MKRDLVADLAERGLRGNVEGIKEPGVHKFGMNVRSLHAEHEAETCRDRELRIGAAREAIVRQTVSKEITLEIYPGFVLILDAIKAVKDRGAERKGEGVRLSRGRSLFIGSFAGVLRTRCRNPSRGRG